MKSTFRVLYFLKRDKVKKDGRMPIMCRITVDGKESRFSMKADLDPKLWDVPMGKVIGRSQEAMQVNTLLDRTRSSLFQIYRELQERENQVSSEKIKNIFLGIETKHHTLLDLFNRHNEDVESLVGINKSKATL